MAAWKADMGVIYVCLNEVPHFEVRSPCFSIALTRLWLEVDARSVAGSEFGSIEDFKKFLEKKHGSVGREIAAMAEIVMQGRSAGPRSGRSLTIAAQRRRTGRNWPSGSTGTIGDPTPMGAETPLAEPERLKASAMHDDE